MLPDERRCAGDFRRAAGAGCQIASRHRVEAAAEVVTGRVPPLLGVEDRRGAAFTIAYRAASDWWMRHAARLSSLASTGRHSGDE